MEDFVASVRVYSEDNHWTWTELKDYINESAALINKNASKIDSALSAFDPAAQTLGYLGLLMYKVALPNSGDFELLFKQISQLADVGSKIQIQEGIDKFCHVCHYLTKCLTEQKTPFRGIIVLMKAIEKAQKSSSQLTSIHADLLKLCLSAKCMSIAIKYLDVDITDVNNEFNNYDSKYFLLYYYYGGMAYLSMKQYEKALFFFQVAVTTPAMVVSHVMLEAYRKYILVSVFLHGKVLPLPKYTSAVVSRYLKPLSTAYTEIADSYGQHDPSHLRTVANKHQAVFQRDENVGLVKQVIASLTKKRIQKLTKTFLTLSLVDMATRVNLPDAQEAENYLLQMIEDGTIYATIDQQAGIVSFHNNPERFNTPGMLEKIEKEMRNCILLNERLLQMDRELQINPNYVQKAMNMVQLDDAGKVENFDIISTMNG